MADRDIVRILLALVRCQLRWVDLFLCDQSNLTGFAERSFFCRRQNVFPVCVPQQQTSVAAERQLSDVQLVVPTCRTCERFELADEERLCRIPPVFGTVLTMCDWGSVNNLRPARHASSADWTEKLSPSLLREASRQASASCPRVSKPRRGTRFPSLTTGPRVRQFACNASYDTNCTSILSCDLLTSACCACCSWATWFARATTSRYLRPLD